MSNPALKLQPDHQGQLDDDLTEVVSKVSLFQELREIREASAVLTMLMTVRTYKAGDTIIREGEQGSDFFILADGSASVYKKTQDGDMYKVVILHGHQGTFFGEGALLEADTRTATLIAETECRCLVLAAKDFEKFCQQNPAWALPIIKRVANAVMFRLRNMNNDLSLLYKALVDEFAQR